MLTQKSCTEKKELLVKNLLAHFDKNLEKMAEQEGCELVQKKLARLFRVTEKLGSEEELLKEAFLLYRLALLSQRDEAFLQAIQKIHEIPLSSASLHLYGSILITLAQKKQESLYVEKAILEFEKALALSSQKEEAKKLILWDLGSSWSLLSDFTEEIYDIKRGIYYFQVAALMGEKNPLFWLLYAESLYKLALLDSHEEHFDRALAYCEKAITYASEELLSRAWDLYAKAFKEKVIRTGKEFDRVDEFFYAACVATPENEELWLYWGECYVKVGWLRKEVHLIERAIEKLSSSNLVNKNSPPFLLLLNQALIMLGMMVEDLKFIREGAKKIASLDLFMPSCKELLYTLALHHLLEGLYFTDVTKVRMAVDAFKKGASLFPRSLCLLHGLFESTLILAILQGEERFFERALSILEEMKKGFPSLALLRYEEATTLLQLFETHRKDLSLLERALSLLECEQEGSSVENKRLFHVGCIFSLLDREEEAIDLFLKVKERGAPFGFPMYYKLATSILHLGEKRGSLAQLKQAEELFEKLSLKRKEDDKLFCDWGYALLILYDYSNLEREYFVKGHKVLLQALSLGSQEANYHIACLYSLAGEVERAILFLKRAERAKVLPESEILLHEKWFERMRDEEGFLAFLQERR